MRRGTGEGRLLAALVGPALLACVTPPPPPDYSKLLAAEIRSVLVVPPVNNSVEVNAADSFLSTLSVPVAERGYYVFPVHMVKRVLEDDGLADASLVHAADPMRLAALFGADSVLYVTIQQWDAKYMVFATQVTVAFEYVLKDGKTGDTLWREKRTAVYTSESGNSGSAADVIVAIVAAAVTKASPNYVPLAEQANASAMGPPGRGVPYGPYRPEHGSDYPHPEKGPAGGVVPAAPAPAPQP